jgi:hypothetical protein
MSGTIRLNSRGYSDILKFHCYRIAGTVPVPIRETSYSIFAFMN